MVTIEHIALWVNDLEQMKAFYAEYFEGRCSENYHNPSKCFTSCFVSFASGARLELMHRPDVVDAGSSRNTDLPGYAHLAVSVGSKQKVDQLTDRLARDGHHVASAPRTTGDGCYESVILDPESNRIEITE